MGKKVKKLIAGALIAGSIIGTGVVTYAVPACDNCMTGRIHVNAKCCDWHCENCGCLGNPR